LALFGAAAPTEHGAFYEASTEAAASGWQHVLCGRRPRNFKFCKCREENGWIALVAIPSHLYVRLVGPPLAVLRQRSDYPSRIRKNQWRASPAQV